MRLRSVVKVVRLLQIAAALRRCNSAHCQPISFKMSISQDDADQDFLNVKAFESKRGTSA